MFELRQLTYQAGGHRATLLMRMESYSVQHLVNHDALSVNYPAAGAASMMRGTFDAVTVVGLSGHFTPSRTTSAVGNAVTVSQLASAMASRLRSATTDSFGPSRVVRNPASVLCRFAAAVV